LADRVGAGDRALEVDREQDVELALPLPRRGIARQDVGAGVVDPHVDAAELVGGLRDEALACLARAEGGLHHQGASVACRDRVSDRACALGRRPVRQQDRRALGREGLSDGAANPAARARHHYVEAVESARGYPSTPAANGWRAASDESRIELTLGSLPRA